MLAVIYFGIGIRAYFIFTWMSIVGVWWFDLIFIPVAVFFWLVPYYIFIEAYHRLPFEQKRGRVWVLLLVLSPMLIGVANDVKPFEVSEESWRGGLETLVYSFQLFLSCLFWWEMSGDRGR